VGGIVAIMCKVIVTPVLSRLGYVRGAAAPLEVL
jgi:hypothetical protein